MHLILMTHAAAADNMHRNNDPKQATGPNPLPFLRVPVSGMPSGQYVVAISLGEPVQQNLHFVVETGSSAFLVFQQADCSFDRSVALCFNTSASSTFHPCSGGTTDKRATTTTAAPCIYNYKYCSMALDIARITHDPILENRRAELCITHRTPASWPAYPKNIAGFVGIGYAPTTPGLSHHTICDCCFFSSLFECSPVISIWISTLCSHFSVCRLECEGSKTKRLLLFPPAKIYRQSSIPSCELILC